VVSQGFRLPAFPQVEPHPHRPQEIIQALFPDLHRTERRIPRASLARSGHRLDIFNHHIGEGEHLPELCHHARFG